MNMELLAFETSGSGRPVIFIHGWNMAASVWHHQLDYFARTDVEALAVDLRGHGASAGMTPFTVLQSARDIKDLVDNKRYDRPVIVGWSMGAMVAIEYALRCPGVAAGICLVGGSPRFTMTEDFPHGLPPKDLQGMKLKLRRDFKRCIGDFRAAISSDLSPDEKMLVANVPLPTACAAMEGLEELASVDLRPRLEQINIPVLLIHGSEDRVCLPGASAYMEGEIKGSERILIEGAGHLPFLSHRKEFNEVLEKFIRRI
ncbi:MAG: alpha/beta fold hydrolase [Proteobacteria bacterium]|nr:alpha/beta fold hydrolase [Pseudomonadota bacterium]